MSSSYPPADAAIGPGNVNHEGVTDEVALAGLRGDVHQEDLRAAIDRSQAAIDRGESFPAEQVLAELDEILFAP